MAEVFLAQVSGVPGFAKLVAVKRLLPWADADEAFTKLFIEEAKISARMSHTNIAKILKFGQIQGRYFLALEYISGKDMRAIHKYSRDSGQHLSVPMVLHVGARLCQALGYAHQLKAPDGSSTPVIHRDVSPPNVIISYDGVVKLIDFGIAKAASKGVKARAEQLRGKVAYMSPEQVAGQPLDQRTDIFSLGIFLHESLTNQLLFQGGSPQAVMQQVRKAQVPPPSSLNRSVPPDVDRIILKALARDREQRYGQAAEMREDIQRYLVRTRTVFGTNHLARWMRAHFTGEIEAERALRQQLRDPSSRGSQDALPSSGVPATEAPVDAPLPRDIDVTVVDHRVDVVHEELTPVDDVPDEELTPVDDVSNEELTPVDDIPEEDPFASSRRLPEPEIPAEETTVDVTPVDVPLEVAPVDAPGSMTPVDPPGEVTPVDAPAPMAPDNPPVDLTAVDVMAQEWEQAFAAAEQHSGAPDAGPASPLPDVSSVDPEDAPTEMDMSPRRGHEFAVAPQGYTPEASASLDYATEVPLPEAAPQQSSPLAAHSEYAVEAPAQSPAPLEYATEAPVSLEAPAGDGDYQQQYAIAPGDNRDQAMAGGSLDVDTNPSIKTPQQSFIAPGEDRDRAAVGGSLDTDRSSPQPQQNPQDAVAVESSVTVEGIDDTMSTGYFQHKQPPAPREVVGQDDSDSWTKMVDTRKKRRISSTQIIIVATCLTLVVAGLVVLLLVMHKRGQRSHTGYSSSGSVIVTTKPAAACTVSLNASRKTLLSPGESISLSGVTPGAHKLMVNCVGYQPFHISIKVTAAQVTYVEAKLHKE